MEGKLGFYAGDCEALLSHLKHQEKLLKLKRRWLMGLPLSKSQENKLLKVRYLPESFLREDDIICETVKRLVEEAFGACDTEGEDCVQKNGLVLDQTNVRRILSLYLDALTNTGLYHIALFLTRGSINFQRTRKQMKNVIKEFIPKVLGKKNQGQDAVDLLTGLSQLLNNPQNIREDYLTSLIPAYSHRASAIRILNGLEAMPSQTLIAMYRKLRGTPAATPQLQQTRYGWSRDTLIHKVRKNSEKMLSEVGGMDELPAPLAKALAIASLSLNLIQGHPSSSVTYFDQFSPSTRTLQNEIAKAIILVKTKVRLPELKALQLLLDPKADVSNWCLRTSMKKMLTEYLFQCGDFDTIPKSLSEALAIVNRSSQGATYGYFYKEEIEKDVECILSVCAQTKQIVWDLLSDCEFDDDFIDAYVEELEESDEGDDNDRDYGDDDDDGGDEDHDAFNIAATAPNGDGGPEGEHLGCPEASIGENTPLDPWPSTSAPTGSCMSQFQETRNSSNIPNVGIVPPTSGINGEGFPLHPVPDKISNINLNNHGEPEKSTTVDTGCPPDPPPSSNHYFKSLQQSVCNSLYLCIQEACDDTSIVAYNLIGHIMKGLAHEEGLDLDQRDNSYLRGDYSEEECQVCAEGEQVSAGNVAGSVVIRAVEELLPSFPKSGMDRLKDLMGV